MAGLARNTHAERVKQETPILVILGNPPYNGFAGMAVDEERADGKVRSRTLRRLRPDDRIAFPDTLLLPGFSRSDTEIQLAVRRQYLNLAGWKKQVEQFFPTGPRGNYRKTVA